MQRTAGKASFRMWTENTLVTKKPHSVMKKLTNSFKAEENKEKAQKCQKYMRNKFEFFGIAKPERAIICKEFMTEDFSQADVYALVSMCWLKTHREFQYFAYELLCKRPQLLLPRTDQYDPMELLKELVVHKSWWDTIDMLASNVIGHLAVADKTHTLAVLEEWIKDENMWLKRCAIIYQLSFKKNTDEQKLFRYCSLCSGHKDFFVQKAIGWALREYAKTNPKAVQKFVKDNNKKLAALSVREALKHLK